MGSEVTRLNIRNCNNITNGKIEFINECLNIKFAANGSGKSTIARAIFLAANENDLSELHSYGTDDEPELITDKPLGKVLIFDENFVNSVVFLEKEVIEKSFEVFIKTPEYEKRLKSVNLRLQKLKIDIGEDEELRLLLNNFLELSKKITLNTTGEITNNPFFKSLKSKQHIYKVPDNLKKYTPFFESEYQYTLDWVEWKNKGYEFDDKGECPFCTEPLIASHVIEKESFTSHYSKAGIKNLIDFLKLLQALEDYLSSEEFELLNSCIKTKTDEGQIRAVFGQFITEINFIKDSVEAIIKFDTYSIMSKDISNLGTILTSMKINTDMLNMFKNEKMISIINNINSKIDSIFEEVNLLKKEIGELNGFVQTSAKETEKDINGFLESAGINYEIEIKINNESDSKTILKYKDRNNNNHDVEKIKDHLSWGERNSFALVLFMHFAISQNADLIILDDPISSFDQDKKYAIVNRLFKNTGYNRSFFGQTVLLMTHDLQPIIDFIVNNKPTGESVCAHHIQNRYGSLSEICINYGDLQSQVRILQNIISDDGIRCLFRIIALRKYIEIAGQNTSEEGNAYNLISSLLKFKSSPDKKITHDKFFAMTQDDISSGSVFIYSFIPTFSYTEILKELIDSNLLIKMYKDESCNYFKIQLFRLILCIDNNRSKIGDKTLIKYIDETYHVENDYLYNLDFREFEMIPDFIIKKCDDFILNIYQ
jgi:ABC-type dipeptide/oligopeptide/nickel transport system ATPase subunit